MKACVFTLGCKVNEVESQSLLRGLADMGYEVTDSLGYADVYILNSCAVTAEAERKSRQTVARMRKFNPQAPVLVCGCASRNHPQDFLGKEGVTVVTGTERKQRLLSLLGARGLYPDAGEREFCEMPPPQRSGTRAFLRIQDGCNNFCSYCIIPYLRGRTRSRAAEKIREEALASGAGEIVLTGIDISSYRDGGRDLGDLLTLLSSVPARIRLGSLEAGIVSEAFLEKMKAAGNCAQHFHLSLQSGSSAVLRKMNRHYTREEYLACCERIYRVFPDAAITTDVIVGFPTETEADFLQSLSIVREAGFAHVHVFPYSPREGTAAARLPDLPAEVKRSRAARLMQAAAEAERGYLTRFLGREAEVLFEEEGGYTSNYIRAYAAGAREGAFCRVRLTALQNDGMKAEILEELSYGNLHLL